MGSQVIRRFRLWLLGAAALGAGCGARSDLGDLDGSGRQVTTTSTTTSNATTTTTTTTGSTTTSTSTTSSTTGPTGPTAICPPTIDTTPLTQVVLVGDATDDGVIVTWHWELVQQPVGSSAAQPAPADAQYAMFTPDVAGEYPLRLTVTDDDGFQDSCDVLLRAIPDENLRVELYWNPPENPYDTSDVDLHLLHPGAPAWFDMQLDCYYANCSAAAQMVLDWDVPGFVYDNPQLDLDDVDGFGPENINLVAPIIGQTYLVGVHYYDADGTGPAETYVKIYCGETEVDPIYLAGPTELTSDVNPQDHQFWKVASLVWNGSSCEVTPIDAIVTTAEAMAHP
jgi:hypothetical protein